MVSALAAACALVVVDASQAGGTVAAAALEVADRVLVVAGDGMSQLSALSVVSTLLASGSGRVGVAMAVCLRGPSSNAGPVARVVESELRWPVLCALEDDRAMAADLVHGMAPGSRAIGPVVQGRRRGAGLGGPRPARCGVTASAPLPPPAWDQIRHGRRPEPQTLATVAEVDVATDGLGGVAARRGTLHAELLGAGPLEPLLDRAERHRRGRQR